MKKSTATDVNKYQKLIGIIYDRLWSAFGLKSTSTPQIGTQWLHYSKSRYELRILSYRRPFQILRSMADLLVRVSVRVRVRAYVSDVIYIYLTWKREKNTTTTLWNLKTHLASEPCNVSNSYNIAALHISD
jgi:hypothetical protein